MDSKEILAKNIRRLIHQNGLNQAQLASLTEVTPGFIAKIIKSKANVSVDVLDRLAIALQVQTSDLLINNEDLPNGFNRVVSVLTDDQTNTVRKWAQQNEAFIKNFG